MHYIKDGIKTFSLLTLSTFIAFLYYHFSNNTTNIATIYILFVFLVARFTAGYFWSVIACISGMLGVNYLFTYPFFELNFTISGYPVTFFGMLVIAVITSTLTAHAKEQARAKALREAYLTKLNEINKQLLLANSASQIIDLILNYVTSITDGNCIFYIKDPIESSAPICVLKHPEHEADSYSDYERAVAHLAYITAQPCGFALNSDSKVPSYETQFYYMPVISHDHTWGLLGLSSADVRFINENYNFLILMLSQMALAFERQALSDEHHQLAIESEKEKMRSNLLRAVSHDLRTPLTSIIGSSATYIDNYEQISHEEKLQLLTQIHEDANWLLHMVENLLSVTRIVRETTKVVKVPEFLEEVVAEAVNRTKKRYPNAQIEVSVPDELISVPMDATLIEQVIINLIENAIKYSHSKLPIQVKAEKDSHSAYIHVIDHGIGIPENQLESIFDGGTLTRNNTSDTHKGFGIGLSICKTIISAHSGSIQAKNLEKGVAFTFTLPLEEDIPEGDDSHDQ